MISLILTTSSFTDSVKPNGVVKFFNSFAISSLFPLAIAIKGSKAENPKRSIFLSSSFLSSVFLSLTLKSSSFFSSSRSVGISLTGSDPDLSFLALDKCSQCQGSVLGFLNGLEKPNLDALSTNQVCASSPYLTPRSTALPQP